MRTLEIEAVLDTAHHKAAALAAYEIRRHLRCFNLKRHPLHVKGDCLLLGDRRWFDFSSRHAVVQAIHEAGEYVEDLPPEVIKRLDVHL